jgi:hypothetical protein
LALAEAPQEEEINQGLRSGENHGLDGLKDFADLD